MKLFSYKKNKPDTEFYSILNRDLAFCGFSEEIKHGFLFILGCSLPNVLPVSDFGAITEIKSVNKILNSYTGIKVKNPKWERKQFLIIDYYLESIHAIILHKKPSDRLCYDDGPCRTSMFDPDESTIKTIHGLRRAFPTLVIKLEPLTNFYDAVFSTLGSYLLSLNFSYQESYQCGNSYLQTSFGASSHSITDIITSLVKFMVPLYKSLFYYPIAYIMQPKAFISNHLFSSIFFYFTAGINPDILKPIHTWHQIIFYKDGTTKLHDDITFGIDVKQTICVFGKASQMREGLLGLGDRYLKNNDLAMPELKGQTRSLNDLLNDLQNILISKYNINAFPTAWNHRGEYMQFLAVLFYETCIHSMVLKEITKSDSSS